MLETVLTGRNLLSPVLTGAATDVEAFDAKVTAANGRAAESSTTSAKAQETASAKVSAASARTAESSSAASAKVVAANSRAAESARAFADVTESSSARAAVGLSSMATKGAGVAAAAVAAIAIVTGKMAGDYQSALTRLSTTAGESQGNLKMVGQGMLDMAGQVGVSAQELAKGMYVVDSAGIHGADSLVVLKAAAQGARQENADLSHVVDAVTTSLHDFHLPASDAAKVTSELIAAVSHGKTTFDELTGSMHSIEPVAVGAGLNIAQTAGALAAMTASGMHADQAAQNLAHTIGSFQNATKPMRDELSQLGLDSQDLQQHMGERGIAGTLQLVADRIRQKVDPAGHLLLSALQTNKTAVNDLSIMIGKMPTPLADMATGLLAGTVAQGDFKKAASALGGEAGAMADQFVAAYKTSDGFSTALKTGGPMVQTYISALAKATGTADGLRTALQLTGENAGSTNAAIAAVGKAAGDTKGNIQGWSEVQGNFNQKLAQAGAEAKSLAIEAGQHLLPVLTGMVGWVGSTGLPGIQHFAGGISDVVHDFQQLPTPVREAALALAALKLADMLGLVDKARGGLTSMGSAFTATAGSARALRDDIQVQQALLAMEARNADAAALSVERLGRAQQSAAVWAASASTAEEASAATAASASARRLAAIEQLTAGASKVTPALSGAQMTMLGWDRQLAGEAPQAASLAEGGVSRFSGAVGAISSRVVPAAKTALSGMMSLLGGPWGVAIAGAVIGISALNSMIQHHDEQVKKATTDVTTWYKTLALGGPTGDVIKAQQHLDDLKSKLAAVTDKITAYNAAAAGGSARGGIGTLITQQSELRTELDKGKKAWDAQLAGMTPVELATSRLSAAEAKLAEVRKDYPANSQIVIAAEAAVATAQHNVAGETDNATRAQKNQLQTMQDAATAALGQIDAQRALEQSQLHLGDAIAQYNSDVASGTLSASQLRQEQLGLVDSAESTAKAAGDAAAKQAAQNGATDTGAASQAAFIKSLQDTADKLNGPAKQAVLDMITAMGGAQSQAALTAGAINQVGVTVIGLPNEKTIEISAPTDKQMKDLHELGYATATLPNGHVVVTADTNPAQTAIQELLAYAHQQAIEYRSSMQGNNTTKDGVWSGLQPGTHATGGFIAGPGTGTSDSIPAWLSNGEYVVQAASVQKYGVGFMHSLNAGKFADGGYVNAAGQHAIPTHVDTSADRAAVHQFWVAAAQAAAAAAVGPTGLGGSIVKSGIQAIVRGMAAARGWGDGGEWNSLAAVINRESGWNSQAANPTSSARGLFQKMTSIHGPLEPTVQGQTNWGLNYIGGRYGDPIGAWAHEAKFGWYKDGTPYVPSDQLAFLHKGEAVVPAAQNQGAPWAASAMPGYGRSGTGRTAVTVAAPAAPAVHVHFYVDGNEFRGMTRTEIDHQLGQLADTIHYAGG